MTNQGPNADSRESRPVVTVSTATAIEASETWKRLAGLVPTIKLYLEPRRGKSEVRMPAASKLPLDVIASDLLRDLDIAATFYVSALAMETPDIKRFPDTLEGMLRLTGERYGHFTTDTDTRKVVAKGRDGRPLKDEDGRFYNIERSLGFDYCDEAKELLAQVGKLVAQPLPPQWMGPCPMCDDGALWLRNAHAGGIRCDTCKAAIDESLWRGNLWRALESRLMERSQIAPAIRLLGGKCSTATVRTWIHRRKLTPVLADSELYRFMDAMELAHITPGESLDKGA